MGRFRAEPPKLEGESTAETLDAWIKEAPLSRRKPEDDERPLPWKKFQRSAKPKHRFVVELNDYHREMLRAAAATAGRSMQKEAQRLLTGSLERSVASTSKRRQDDDE
jgi:hypothetical protein